jgi:hypothetical protein
LSLTTTAAIQSNRVAWVVVVVVVIVVVMDYPSCFFLVVYKTQTQSNGMSSWNGYNCLVVLLLVLRRVASAKGVNIDTLS